MKARFSVPGVREGKLKGLKLPSISAVHCLAKAGSSAPPSAPSRAILNGTALPPCFLHRSSFPFVRDRSFVPFEKTRRAEFSEFGDGQGIKLRTGVPALRVFRSEHFWTSGTHKIMLRRYRHQGLRDNSFFPREEDGMNSGDNQDKSDG